MSKDKLTKAEIIEHIYENIDSQTKISRKDIHSVLDCFFNEVVGALTQDKIIELRGFGTFEVRTRKGRERARNPKTGEILPVNTHGVAAFRPGRDLKNLVWSVREPSE